MRDLGAWWIINRESRNIMAGFRVVDGEMGGGGAREVEVGVEGRKGVGRKEGF